MRRILFCLAVLALAALAFAGCGGTDAAQAAQTTTETMASTADTQATEVAQEAPELSDFVIVRPDGESEYLPLCNKIRERVKRMTGVELLPKSDLVIPGTAEPAFEILLADTRRAISKEIYEALPEHGYAVVYREGKLVIAGRGDEPLQAAVGYFFAHYFEDNAFTLPEQTDYRAQYQYKDYYEVLVGKSINVMGDSYVDPASLPDGKIWPALLAEKYGMDYKSYGKSGNAVGSPLASGEPMVTRYKQMRAQADIIFVVGGRNDYNQRFPVGHVGDEGTDTFCGALGTLLDGLKARYPDSLILYSTSWYVNEAMRAYTDATLAVCAEKGIPCFNAAKQSESGVYMDDSAFRAKYCIKPEDVSHLNADGMRLVLPKFERFIAEEAQRFFK